MLFGQILLVVQMEKDQQLDNKAIAEDRPAQIYGLRILRDIRRILRAVDIHSHKLNSEFNITVPQMICLNTLYENEISMTQAQLAKKVNLSISTVNGILDRLENKKLITRQPDTTDRRKVIIVVTDKGRDLLNAAPSLLQDTFAHRLEQLPDLEVAAIAFSLERVVQLMGADEIDASPLLMPTAVMTEPTQGS